MAAPRPTDHRNFYDVLGVARDCSEDDLRRAYRGLALNWHPDKKNQADKAEAERVFKNINEAYQVLGDPDQREVYDRATGGRGRWGRPAGTAARSARGRGGGAARHPGGAGEAPKADRRSSPDPARPETPAESSAESDGDDDVGFWAYFGGGDDDDDSDDNDDDGGEEGADPRWGEAPPRCDEDERFDAAEEAAVNATPQPEEQQLDDAAPHWYNSYAISQTMLCFQLFLFLYILRIYRDRGYHPVIAIALANLIVNPLGLPI